jgi:hypothetical protein
MQSVGAQILHVENASGFKLDELARALDTPYLTVLSSHDFGLFCPRPHLIESVTGTFCDFCRDRDRCGRCLAVAGGAPPGGILEHRRLARRLFERASCLVFPSPYAMETTADLFPESSSISFQEVIPPATNRQVPEGPWRRHPQRVAIIGGLQVHKGGALIDRLAKSLQAITRGAAELHVFGEVDHHIATSMAGNRSVRIHGYYRPGRLPQLLARFGITAAVLPSIWPETYSLVVDECLSARTPVVAFDLGAVAERLERWEVGRRVPLSHGADGLARALAETLEVPPLIPELPLPTPAGAAREHLCLYRRLIA